MSDDVAVLICSPVSRPSHVAGSETRMCRKCGIGVWVSPESLRAAMRHRKPVVFECVPCVMAEGVVPDVRPLSAGQLREVIEHERDDASG